MGTIAVTGLIRKVTGQAAYFPTTNNWPAYPPYLSPGASCTFTVTYRRNCSSCPSPVVGERNNAALSVSDNASGSPQQVALKGFFVTGP
jgi:hypothetical protein